ncbi:MAG: hypothetical protein IE916_01180 [Epsilonproteobacteria bacterium]|nr:hypothetical protein [Campylobacterota bacterium]
MLENSVWRQYNQENNFRTALSQYCNVDIDNIMDNEKALYGVMKAKLTKKELRLFSMIASGMSDNDMQKELELSYEDFLEAKRKVLKKLKQDKIKMALREVVPMDDEELF